MPQPTKLIGVVERALDIMERFNEWTRELGPTQIAQATRLHKSSAAGLIDSLAAKGYLAPNPAKRKCRLGPEVIGRAKVVPSSMDLRQTAMPYLHRLRDCFNETVNLAIADAGGMVCAGRPLCAHALGLRSEGGKRVRAHSTALGKAILAYFKPADLKVCVARYGLPSATAHTITDQDTLQQHLEATRRQGYTVDDEKNQVGGRCVAAPIFGYAGRPIAVVSISLPSARLALDAVPHSDAQVRDAARAISANLGYAIN